MMGSAILLAIGMMLMLAPFMKRADDEALFGGVSAALKTIFHPTAEAQPPADTPESLGGLIAELDQIKGVGEP